MPRKKPFTSPHGRPKIDIDWDMVDDYLECGCKGNEIASAIGCCPDTLYERCMLEKGILFSTYKQQKKEKGDTALRKAQHYLAIAADRGMLIWLGKQRLGQTDNPREDDRLEKQLGLLNHMFTVTVDGDPIPAKPEPKPV